MQIELSTVFAVGSGILTALFGIYVGTLRYAIASRDREIDRRIETLDTAVKSVQSAAVILADRLATEERETVRLDGAIQLLAQALGAVQETITDMHRSMVKRDEWAPRMDSIERQLNKITSALTEGYKGGSKGVSSTYPRYNLAPPVIIERKDKK